MNARNPDMSDLGGEDPWDRVSRAAGPDDLNSPQGEGDPAGFEQQDVVDAEAVELAQKPRKSKLVPVVFGLIMVAVVGATASGVYTLYGKLFPKSQSQEVANSQQMPARASDTEVPRPADTTAAVDQSMLAGQPGASAASMIGSAQAPSASVEPPAQPASAAVAPQPTVAPSQPAAAESKVEPVAVSAPTPVVAVAAPARVEAAAPAAAVTAPSPAPAPAAQLQAAVQSAKSDELSSRNDGRAERRAKRAAEKQAARERAAANAKVRQEQASERAAAQAKARQEKREALQASKAGVTRVAVRRSATAPSAGTRKGAVAATAAAASAESAPLHSYKLESISPQHGEHQMAWVRSMDGKLKILTTGDVLDGMRVIKVDAGLFTVRTTQGEIR